ncbi:quinolinate synthase NadA, partial [candidate division WOR-3 bacterium]|nr:quinolinate synthase NadA [candidate division WOR-3 bacterium]
GMKMTRIEDVLRSLEKEIYEIKIPDDIMERAGSALERMVKV